MSYEVYKWMKALHIFSFIMWTGSLLGAVHILKAHADAGGEASGAFLKLEKGTGMMMDIGATLAILFGVVLIVGPERGTEIFKAGGFFHAKLTLVAAFIGLHVVIRKSMVGFKKGNGAAPPSWVRHASVLCLLGIVIMMVVQPF